MAQKRVQPGVPAGGQYSQQTHDEATGSLVEEVRTHGDPDDYGWGAVDHGNMPHVGSRTPWGAADYADEWAPGIVSVGTPGHGGIKLSKARNAAVDPAWRKSNGWYEEDCDWAIVAMTFPNEPPEHMRGRTDEYAADAAKMVRDYYPDAYEKTTGETIQPGESYARDEATFAQVHAGDQMTISAIGVDHDGEDMVLVTATTGGKRQEFDGPEIQKRQFLVPTEEYQARDGSFVIDPSRHHELATSEAEIVKVRSDLTQATARAKRARAEGRLSDALENEEWAGRYAKRLAEAEAAQDGD